uniref:Transposase n=1 Tax=Heterorhabditis bacteriophora TaxID=37862 RepID=A0A1I7WRG4_HETBA
MVLLSLFILSILGYQIKSGNKQIRVILLYQFKIECKAPKLTSSDDWRQPTEGHCGKELDVDQSTVVRHWHQIGTSKKLDKWVSLELNEYQKNSRYEICPVSFLCNKIEPVFGHIVTSDDKWIPYDRRQRPAQWLDEGEAPEHFLEPKLHPEKVSVTVWWSGSGIIYYNFLDPGKSMTAEKYYHEIDKMHQELERLRSALVIRKEPILLDDQPHVSQMTP